ncbi:hypothetical protein [Lyngbya sp. CCY1209]|uniref:ArnT family glycosyltransferase n=1 Tax=Lyngbya sp. CCY1209 TaxID=2886103 RepID=UPI002D2095C2|nr:hypothetical protein [Lyngbya sp. CCY1209]MEB3883450.1 glycosyltransferase family 39 protein [Lyngbya sp. CCY1209]
MSLSPAETAKPSASGDRIWKDSAIAIALFALTILTRLPFHTQFPEGDEGHFAMAVREFDVSRNQPQMPGMFIIFIWMARFFNLFIDDPTLSLVAVNIVASGVTVAALFLLGNAWYNRRVGWSVSLLALTSPLFWYYGETAFSHALEFCWVVLIYLAAYYTGLGDRRALFSLAILMGLAGGIRPSTPFFLLPLALVAVFFGWRRSRKTDSQNSFTFFQVILAFGVGWLAVALWFVPLIASAGGWQSYWELVQNWLPVHTTRQDADSLGEVFDNVMVLMKAYFRVVGLAIIPMFWMLVRDRTAIGYLIRRDWKIQSSFAALIPGLLYFSLVHLRRKPQTFTIMPAVLIMGGLTMVWWGDRLSKYHRQAWAIVTAAIVGLNGLFFLFGPPGMPTAGELRRFNLDVGERIEFVRDRFPPETTVVLTRDYYYRLMDLYFQNYQLPDLSHDLDEDAIVLPPHIRTLVLFDDRIFSEPGQAENFQTMNMPSDRPIRYLNWLPEWQVKLSENGAILMRRQ